MPGSTFMYGSNFCMVTFMPRLFRRRPIDAAVMPLPREDTTPPVTKIYFIDIVKKTSLILVRMLMILLKSNYKTNFYSIKPYFNVKRIGKFVVSFSSVIAVIVVYMYNTIWSVVPSVAVLRRSIMVNGGSRSVRKKKRFFRFNFMCSFVKCCFESD